METITVSKPFEGDPREMAERCRHLDARRAWPGAVLMGGSGDTLYYQVAMRLKGAAMTDIDIEEHQDPIGEDADGTLRFRTRQKVSWPDGTALGEAEYAVTPASAEAPAQLAFTYRYEPPSTKLVKTKALPAFHAAMEKVSSRYLKLLVETGGR